MKLLIGVLVEDSLKYHRLHPEYIHQRIEKLGNAYNLRILLLMCDVVSDTAFILLLGQVKGWCDRQSEHQEPIRELTKVCLINNITIMMCWSYVSIDFHPSKKCLTSTKSTESKKRANTSPYINPSSTNHRTLSRNALIRITTPFYEQRLRVLTK